MKRQVIIDCDPGIDDSLALMMALNMAELDVLGITVVCGNCPVSMGVQNAKKVLNYLGRLDVPVFKGAEHPLKREYNDALDTHGNDGLGGCHLPEVSGYDQTWTAEEFLASKIRETGCSVIEIGPMTNLAGLIMMDPDAFLQIDELVSMGGNFRSYGNCSPVAEFNYWEDPDAAALVYDTMASAGKKVHMIGLDVTRQIVLTPDLVEYLKRISPKQGSFVQSLTDFYMDFHWEKEHLIGCVINDPLAVAYFADRKMCSGIEAYTQVETEGISVGQTIVDYMDFYHKPANSVVLTKASPRRFFRLFFKTVTGADEKDLDLLDRLVAEEK